jgi:hypothetical protein
MRFSVNELRCLSVSRTGLRPQTRNNFHNDLAVSLKLGRCR